LDLYSESDEARFVPEDGPRLAYRSEFRKDFARVIHCASFRRLQGKTQLFPGYESDFFRNRLTHSLEVGQIAESIALCANETDPFFKQNPIKAKICFTAALLHDIGHPPFGHNGEAALDKMMLDCGGFEGNAQTLRIVTQLEKKRYRTDVVCPLERRAGLNLTYRTLAAVLKYDRLIPRTRSSGSKVSKGYYFEDSPIVDDIKKNVAPGWKEADGQFKSLECSIMDISDDIAYSTYDLEDSLKAGFLTPSKILTSDPELLIRVARIVSDKLNEKVSARDVLTTFAELFTPRIDPALAASIREKDDDDLTTVSKALQAIEEMEATSTSGQARTEFTAALVGRFVEAVTIDVNEELPALSKVKVEPEILRTIEIVKTYTYEAVIASSRVKLAEYRGQEVVGGIFKALSERGGHKLLPEDALKLFLAANGDKQKEMRVLSDFVAGMTDRYAIEFYGRLHSDSPQTIFKDL
jgi:dGTPase